MCSRRHGHFWRASSEQSLKTRLFGSIATLVFLCAMLGGQTPSPLAASPDKITFPKTSIGSQSAPLTVTLTNPAPAPVQMEDIVVSGIDFNQTNNCGKQLAANASCSIQITFRPAISGERLGSLEIVGSGANTPQFVALDGTGE